MIFLSEYWEAKPSKSFRSSSVIRVGSFTLTRTSWFPLATGLPSLGTPLFSSERVVFGCVPLGIFKLTLPSTVVISTVSPKIACK